MMKIDQVIRTRRKSIALIVERDGRLVVRAPLRVTNRQIQALVEQKAEWIRARQSIALAAPQFAPKEYVNGEGFWFLGKSYRLEIVETAAKVLALDGVFRLRRAALPRAREVFTAWYREQARQVISERVTWYGAKTGLRCKQIKITSAQTRWGSCNAKGALSFAWRLVMAPVEMVDYVVVHELVHTLERNHQGPFWAKLKAILPDYKQRIAWFKANGHLLVL